jgi:hypothetical protein
MADGCVGLQCVPAGNQAAVPEAAQAHPKAAGPGELWTKRPGFYEYDDPAGGGRIVAYVVQPGEAEGIPESVSAMKVVGDLRASGQLGNTAVLILGPEMASIAPAQSSVAARRARPRAVAADYNQCAASYFCLWATAGYYGWVSWLGRRIG